MKIIPILLAIASVPMVQGMPASSDLSAPTWSGITLSTTAIDTTAGAQPMLVTARLADDLSGVVSASVTFRRAGSPTDSSTMGFGFHAGLRSSGDDRDGLYATTLVVPAGCPSGRWVLSVFTAYDQVGNRRTWGHPELVAAGMAVEFTVTGTDDVLPPEIVSVSVTPRVVDTSEGPQTLLVTVRIRDTGAGMDSAPNAVFRAGTSLGFVSATRRQRVATSFEALVRASGDARDGVYTNRVVLPRFSEAGRWWLEGVSAMDAAGNQVRMDSFAALPREWESSFTVTGIADTQPPVVRSLDFHPRWVDASESARTITFSLGATDDLAGVGSGDPTAPPGLVQLEGGGLAFTSPSRNQSVGVSFDPRRRQAAVNSQDAAFTNVLVLPRFSEAGIWTMSGLTFRDAVGNRVELTPGDLRRLGFPTELGVGVAPVLAVQRFAESVVLAWPDWAAEFRLETGDPGGPPGHWTPLGDAAAAPGGSRLMAVPASTGARLFRLRLP